MLTAAQSNGHGFTLLRRKPRLWAGEEGEERVLLRSRADKATAKQNRASERFRPTGKPVGLHHHATEADRG